MEVIVVVSKEERNNNNNNIHSSSSLIDVVVVVDHLLPIVSIQGKIQGLGGQYNLLRCAQGLGPRDLKTQADLMAIYSWKTLGGGH